MLAFLICFLNSQAIRINKEKIYDDSGYLCQSVIEGDRGLAQDLVKKQSKRIYLPNEFSRKA